MDKEKITHTGTLKRRLTVAVVSTLLAISLLIAGSFYWSKEINMETFVQFERQTFLKNFDQTLENYRHKYRIAGLMLLETPGLLDAVERKDHDTLIRLTAPAERIAKRECPSLSIFHFIDNENRSLLRLHQMEKYGDDLTNVRPLVRYVNETGKEAAGFEMGKYGIAYRIAIPVVKEGRQLGVLEMGVDVSHLSQLFQRHHLTQTTIFLREAIFDKYIGAGKEALQKMGGYVRYATNWPEGERLFTLEDLEREYAFYEVGNKALMAFSGIHLKNFQGEEIGQIVLAKEFTAFSRQTTMMLVSFMSLLLVLLLFFYLLFRYGIGILFSEVDHLFRMLEMRNRKLEKMTQTDFLTKTLNRKTFRKMLV